MSLDLLANAIDNFIHGLTVGSAFLISNKSGYLSSLGILLHEIPHEFGDFAILLNSGKTILECSLCQISTSITSFLGGMFALFIGKNYQYAALNWLLPVSSGGFLFIALSTFKNALNDSVNTESCHAPQLVQKTKLSSSSKSKTKLVNSKSKSTLNKSNVYLNPNGYIETMKTSILIKIQTNTELLGLISGLVVMHYATKIC